MAAHSDIGMVLDVADAAAGKADMFTRRVTRDEAAYILGRAGKTKAKLNAVSGATINLVEAATGCQLQVRGSDVQRRRCLKYVEFVIAQRLGPVDIADPQAHDDLTILGVPANTVSFITGKGGSFLRLVEEEWCTLLFFLRLDPARPPQRANPLHVESLAIFGPERRRWGAQLKVMAAIEMKVMGYFTQTVGDHESLEDGFAIDTVRIREEDYSYALGKNGSTRKKLAKASGCTVEYVGRVAYLCGVRSERGRAREYLRWRLCQRAGERVHIDHRGRSDVTVVMVGAATAGFIAGQRGALLHAIEERTGTLCFFEGGGAAAPRQSSEEGPRPLLIFGRPEHRRAAEAEVWDRIDHCVFRAGRRGIGGGREGRRRRRLGPEDREERGRRGEPRPDGARPRSARGARGGAARRRVAAAGRRRQGQEADRQGQRGDAGPAGQHAGHRRHPRGSDRARCEVRAPAESAAPGPPAPRGRLPARRPHAGEAAGAHGRVDGHEAGRVPARGGGGVPGDGPRRGLPPVRRRRDAASHPGRVRRASRTAGRRVEDDGGHRVEDLRLRRET
ncbi:unnamed protein product [Prorocentrum cordatum]|uniref:K Homology domain-containing protein n=1 Tax=Prorocentrum cordatum TaxID=2364126 RepID=A0ABN9X0G6_9DINO|nr:unnamed protein product [Polarella glacialis]